jgi:hypothetical protein
VAYVLPPASWLAANADRERAADVIRAGFTEGRLTQEEFSERVSQVYASRTYGQLGELTADLPAGPMPSADSEASSDRRPLASTSGLILTAITVFVLAAFITGVAVLLYHAQSPALDQGPIRLMPAITHLHGHG